jgi:hypothetical protein
MKDTHPTQLKLPSLVLILLVYITFMVTAFASEAMLRGSATYNEGDYTHHETVPVEIVAVS